MLMRVPLSMLCVFVVAAGLANVFLGAERPAPEATTESNPDPQAATSKEIASGRSSAERTGSPTPPAMPRTLPIAEDVTIREGNKTRYVWRSAEWKPVELLDGWDQQRLWKALSEHVTAEAAKRLPGCRFQASDNTFTVLYKSREYETVKEPEGVDPTNVKTAGPVVGPDKDGLILRLQWQNDHTRHPKPRVFDRGPWRDLYAEVHLPTMSACIEVRVGYGPETDARLIQQLVAPSRWLRSIGAIAQPAPETAGPAAQPDTPENRKAARDAFEAPPSTQPGATGKRSFDGHLADAKGRLAAILPDTMAISRAEVTQIKAGLGLLLHASPADTTKTHPSFGLLLWPRLNNGAPPFPGSGAHTWVRIGQSEQFVVFYSGPPRGVLATEVQRAFCENAPPPKEPAGLNLDAAAKMLTEKVGGNWRKHRYGFPDLGDILLGDVPIGDAKLHYTVFPFPLDDKTGRAKLGAYANCCSQRPGILGSNDKCTVLTHAPRSPAHKPVTQALGLMPTVVSLEDLAETFDWNRMWEQVLSACAEAGKGHPSLAAFRAGARASQGNKELAAWKYESNVVIDRDRQPMACTREDPQQPYYYVRLSIQSMHTGPSDVSAESPSIAWDGKSNQRVYALKWLGLVIRITVLSDDAEFVKAINAILDEEVTRALRRCAPQPPEPAKGLKVSVWTDKTEFTLDEPVLVHWKIENVGKTDREILWGEWGRRPVFFEIETPGAKKIEYGSYGRYFTTQRGPMQPEKITLQAGGGLKADLNLNGFFFRGYRDPGTYEVTGLYYPVAGYTGEKFLTTEKFKDVIVDRIASAPIRIDIVSTSKQSTEDLSGLRKGMTRASVREYLGEPNMSFGRGRTRIAYSRKNGPDGAPRWLILTFDQRVGNRGDYSTTKLLSWKIVPRGIVTPPDASPGMRKGFVEGYHSGYLHGLRGESEACPGAAKTPAELRAAASKGFYTGQYHGYLERMGVEQGKPINSSVASDIARADIRVRDAELSQRLIELGSPLRRVTASGNPAWLITFYDLRPDDNPSYILPETLEARARRIVVAGDGTWVISDPKEVEKYRPPPQPKEARSSPAEPLTAPGVPAGPPGGDRAAVPVNSQKTLIEVVGKQFTDTDWEYPSDLLPEKFPGLEHVSGPGDPGLSGKAAWRKPVTFKHGASGTEVFVNCYRRREEPARPRDPNLPGTPSLPLEEPDYRYQSAEFHALKAAAAGEKTRDVFVFLDGDILFKVEASGGSPERRRALVRSTAEAIWKFRHREDTATGRKGGPT